MDPAIPVHSVVLVQPVAPEELQPGEIVAYRSGSSVVIHRLVENHIVEGELVTKGDANAEPDPLKVEYAAYWARSRRTSRSSASMPGLSTRCPESCTPRVYRGRPPCSIC